MEKMPDHTKTSSWKLESHMPKGMLEAVLKLPDQLIEASEYYLKKKLKAAYGKEDFTTLEIIKVNFWQKYRDNAAKNNTTCISIHDVIEGNCSWPWWKKHVIGNQLVLAYMIAPPGQEYGRMQVIVNRSLERLAEVFELPLEYEDAKGNVKVNTQLIGQMHSITKTLLDRIHGTAIQRAHVHTTGNQPPGSSIALPDAKLLADMNTKLAELKAKADSGDTVIEAAVEEKLEK